MSANVSGRPARASTAPASTHVEYSAEHRVCCPLIARASALLARAMSAAFMDAVVCTYARQAPAPDETAPSAHKRSALAPLLLASRTSTADLRARKSSRASVRRALAETPASRAGRKHSAGGEHVPSLVRTPPDGGRSVSVRGEELARELEGPAGAVFFERAELERPARVAVVAGPPPTDSCCLETDLDLVQVFALACHVKCHSAFAILHPSSVRTRWRYSR